METKKIVLSVIASIVGLFLIITLFKCFKTIPTGYVGIKTRFGKVQNTMIYEGINFKVPYIEKIIKIDCRTQKIEANTESSTKDMQVVNVSVAINYNVNKETANKLYQEVGKDYQNIIIQPAILESIKSVMARYNAEELITRRTEVSNAIQEELSNKINARGFNITDFNITNIDFSSEYNKAIETKAVKQQEVETAKYELEKQKIQNEKEIAEAEKDARVMELQNNQITENTLKLKVIEKWNGQLPTTSLSENILAMLGL